ncbi:MAG: TlpA family protein disulfide reductase [Betaproteobacteria bacterium]|nr:TlpA family protein disulfide reductase [Betaproteobacteria bacterium]
MKARITPLRIWALASLVGLASAADLRETSAIPHLGQRGVESYREFLASPPHRAFVIAPGDAWAWRVDLPSAQAAERAALEDCREHTDQTCVAYAVDNRVVFDAKAWPKLWGPYATADTAKRAPVGTRRGERLPDLVFRNASGQKSKVSDFRGKVLLLHFWGSWCGPCRKELPDLLQLLQQTNGERDIRAVFLPVREPFDLARKWASQQKLPLPLFDGGNIGGSGENDNTFALADGSRLPDRQIAGKFPTTYVLDKHGLVIFTHVGNASRWGEYAPFLRDAAARSGK